MMKRRVTLADLSKKTGLSQATISMILAKRSDVSFSEETVRLVQKTARELGYFAVRHRRMALFSRRTIMVVCPFLINHYYSAVVQTLQSQAAEMQCNVLVYATYNNSDEESKILKVMAESDIGGIIFAMMPQSRNLLRKISRNIPVVIIADRDGEEPVDVVELHNYHAGELIARHLAELGHKNIICISTPLLSSIPARTKRFEGIRDTWKQLCPQGEVRLFTNFLTPAMMRDVLLMERILGEKITQAVLENEPCNFTAIVALNDMLAYGVLDALNANGKSVPEDFSVCGCDNDFPSDLVGVNLTSVEHFMAQNAQQAFKILYRSMTRENQYSDIIPLKNIQPELVKRASTARPHDISRG